MNAESFDPFALDISRPREGGDPNPRVVAMGPRLRGDDYK